MPGRTDTSLVKIENTTVRRALRDFRKQLKTLFVSNEPAIFLYGSYARGEANPESDVDVLLLYPYDIHPSSEIRRLSRILADINLRHQVLISVLPTNREIYQTSQEPFWQNVRRDGISI